MIIVVQCSLKVISVKCLPECSKKWRCGRLCYAVLPQSVTRNALYSYACVAQFQQLYVMNVTTSVSVRIVVFHECYFAVVLVFV